MATITVYKDVNIDDACSPMFVAVGSSATANSNPAPTNTTWTARTLPANISWNCLCYGNGLIVALASNSNTHSTSVDGITWVGRSFPIIATMEDIIYIKPSIESETQGVFMAISSEGSVIISMDGVDWYLQEDLPLCESFGWSRAAADEESGVVVVVADTMFDTIAQGVYANLYVDEGFAVMDMPSGAWKDVCFGAGLFVAISPSPQRIATSPDGVNWTLRDTPILANWQSICYGDKFVVIADNSNVSLYSYDGITWYSSTMPSASLWVSVAAGRSTNGGNMDYTAISATTAGAYSYDGIKWYSRVTTIANLAAVCYAPITWNSGDTLVINNGATVTVNTNQQKFWKTITGNNGKLRIENSSSEPITFAMGRNSGTTANDITPQSGLFSIEVEGDWIEIGTGTGDTNQEFTSPYGEYIPVIWVETAIGTGIYDSWLNISGPSERGKFFAEQGLALVSSGIRGNYFEQAWGLSIPARLSVEGISVIGSRDVFLNPDGIYPGAYISTSSFPTNTVVNTIDRKTYILSMSAPATASGTSTYLIYNPVQSQMSNILVTGNGINGNIVPAGAKVRVPNIMITDYTPANVITASNYVDCYINMSNGSSLSLNKCLFGQSYVNMSQAKSVYVRDVGFSYKFQLTECGSVDMDRVGIAATPPYWYLGTRWICRDMRYSTYLPLGYTAPTNNGSIWYASYINNASIRNFNCVSHNPMYIYGSSGSPSSLYISNSDGIYTENITNANIDVRRATTYGLTLGPLLSNSTFKDVKVFSDYTSLSATTTSNCKIDGYKYSFGMSNYTSSFLTGCRIVRDPANWNYLINDKKYYIKVRTYYSWHFADSYVDSIEYSVTPFQSNDINFPDYVSIIPDPTTVPGRVTISWVRKGPESTVVLYEIYRDVVEGFTSRTSTNRIYTSATAATVAYNDDTGNIGTRYYYRFRKYHTLTAKTGCSAASGSTTLTNSGSFYTFHSTAYFSYKAGDTIVSNYSYNLYSLPFYEGCLISGNHIQTGTRVVRISPDGKDMEISLPTTADSNNSTVSLPIQAGMAVNGTGIGPGTVVVSVESSNSLTLSNPVTGTISGASLNFQTFSESAELSAFKVASQTKIKNFCLQSRALSTTWVASNMTIVANAYCPPTSVAWNTGASSTLTATSTNASITQSISGLTIGSVYTVSIAVRADQTLMYPDGIAGAMTFGVILTSFMAKNEFSKVSVTMTATSTSHNLIIYVLSNGTSMVVSDVMVNSGGTPLPHINTTTAAVELNPGNLPITALAMWCKSANICGYNNNQGIQVSIGTAPTGSYYSEIHLSDTPGFTPSKLTCVGNTKLAFNRLANISTYSANNIIKDVEQIGYGMVSPGSTAPMYLSDNSSGNAFINGSVPVECNAFSDSLMYFNYGSNNNIVHNYNVGLSRNYVGMITSTSPNYSSGNTIQNCKSLNSDTIISNQMSNSIIKNITGGLASPYTNATTYAIGAAADSIDDIFTAVYGSMFYESDFGNGFGVLHIAMEDTLTENKPYTVISGSPYFSNTGRLHMYYQGDCIEIEWPHRIYGVSGFRDVTPKMLGSDLGYLADKLDGLSVEYSISTTDTYSAYKNLDRYNLRDEIISPEIGFRIKFKLTTKTFMKLSSRTGTPNQGDPVRGVSSGAAATVVDLYINAAYGTLSISGVSGNFLPSEAIQTYNGSSWVALANNSETNTFALGPSYGSYIASLQIFTITNNVSYKPKYTNFLLNNIVVGSTYWLYDNSTSEVIATGIVSGSGEVANYNVIVPFDFSSDNVEITIKVRKASSGVLYKPFQTISTYNSNGGSVYISQIPDV